MIGGPVNAAEGNGLVVFGAGSLREAIGEITRTIGAARSVEIRTEFCPSGRMRERIERGERVDQNPAAPVRGAQPYPQERQPRCSDGDEARKLLDSVDVSTTWPTKDCVSRLR
jgi:ABC-type molybdate transport system substrate-binding protein